MIPESKTSVDSTSGNRGNLICLIICRIRSRQRIPCLTNKIVFPAPLPVAFAVAVSWSFISALTISAIIRVVGYLVGCGSLLQLRKTMKEQKDYFKVRYGNILAVIGILLSFWLLSAAKLSELRNAAIFLSAGVVLFLLQMNFLKKGK